MLEIPVEEAKYEELFRILVVIHPKPVLPTDESVESLLKLSEYFQMPYAVAIVEEHLLGSTHFDFFQTLFIADQYKIQKGIGLVKTLDHVTKTHGFPELESRNHITE